ncbi:hypothetical protein ACWEQL_31760 [Kitasatospora sp. NPDC004240]
MRELIRRAWFLPLAGALGASLVLVLTVAGAVAEWREANRIDASPVRVEATITDARPVKGGTSYTLTYRVADREYSTDALGLKGVKAPGIGVKVPLEVAAEHPESARVAGSRHPDDDEPPTLALAAVGATAALAICLWFVRTGVKRGRAAHPIG